MPSGTARLGPPSRAHDHETRDNPVRETTRAVVQIDRVREIQTLFGRSRVVLRNGKEIPLSRRCRRKLEEFEPSTPKE